MRFDNRSFALSDELNLSLRDREVVAGLDKHFLADLDDSRELQLAAWRSRPLARRTKELASAAIRREL